MWLTLCHVSLALAAVFPTTLPTNWEQTPAGEWHALETSGVNPDVISTSTYRDFELTVDFKLPPNGNSGIRYLLLTEVEPYLAAIRKFFLLMAGVAMLAVATAVVVLAPNLRAWRKPLAVVGMLGYLLYARQILAAGTPSALAPLVPAVAVFIVALIMPEERFGELYLRVPFLLLALLNIAVAPYAWRQDQSIHSRMVAKPIGLEFQLVTPGSAESRAALTDCGALYGMIASSGANCSPNQWHRARLVVKGSEVEHWIDNKQVLAYSLTSAEVAQAKEKLAPRYGPLPQVSPGLWLRFAEKQDSPIALEHHGQESWFRNPSLVSAPPTGPGTSQQPPYPR
ncbi:MAG: DUF1080 domain-containing protein [Bryobacterales bacterium]|nr:DUF1080 domain-containing protein [Bryobacterales bacterium]